MATFGVIFLHVSGTGIHLPVGEYNWYVAFVGDGLVRWSVPVFVMISGALFLKPEKGITIRTILTKYVKRLLTAYLFWYLAYMAFIVAIASMSAGTFTFNASFLRPHFHLWFLPMLMGVYLLIPILRKVVCEAVLLKYALVLWLVYLTVSFVLVEDVPQISHLFTMNWVVGYAGFFLLGYYLSKTSLSKRQRNIIYVLGLLGALTTVFGSISLSFHRGVHDEKFLFNISPQVATMAATLFVLVKEATSKIEKRVNGIVEYVRKDLFGIYLVHGFWLWAINRAIFRDMANHIVTLPLITILVFILSLYTTKLIRAITLLKRVVV